MSEKGNNLDKINFQTCFFRKEAILKTTTWNVKILIFGKVKELLCEMKNVSIFGGQVSLFAKLDLFADFGSVF